MPVLDPDFPTDARKASILGLRPNLEMHFAIIAKKRGPGYVETGSGRVGHIAHLEPTALRAPIGYRYDVPVLPSAPDPSPE